MVASQTHIDTDILTHTDADRRKRMDRQTDTHTDNLNASSFVVRLPASQNADPKYTPSCPPTPGIGMQSMIPTRLNPCKTTICTESAGAYLFIILDRPLGILIIAVPALIELPRKRVHVCTCVCVCKSVGGQACACACAHLYMRYCARACVCVLMLVCVCVCVCVCEGLDIPCNS